MSYHVEVKTWNRGSCGGKHALSPAIRYSPWGFLVAKEPRPNFPALFCTTGRDAVRERTTSLREELRFSQRREDALLTREDGSTIAYLGRESDAVRMLTNKSLRNCAAAYGYHRTSPRGFLFPCNIGGTLSRQGFFRRTEFRIFDRGGSTSARCRKVGVKVRTFLKRMLFIYCR